VLGRCAPKGGENGEADRRDFEILKYSEGDFRGKYFGA